MASTLEVISISASTIVIQALLTGEVDFIVAPSATLVTSKLAGADTVMVSTNLPLFIDHIVSLGSITTIEQLKGKFGGVNRLGTTSDMTLRLALRRLGVDPEKETKIIATGENPQRLAALANNITQFTLLGEPLVREAEKLGFRDLFDIGTLKIPYHVNAIVTREKTVKERRPLVQKVVRAFTEALHYIKTNKEDTKALIGKNLKTKDPEGLERAYKAYNSRLPRSSLSARRRRQNPARRHGPARQKSWRRRSEEFRRYELGAGVGSVGVYQAAV